MNRHRLSLRTRSANGIGGTWVPTDAPALGPASQGGIGMATVDLDAELHRAAATERVLVGDGALQRHFNPAREVLWAKIAGLEQNLRMLREGPAEVLQACWANLTAARACIDKRWGHSHLAWRFLHRVDEDLLLVLPAAQLQARALDVKAELELSVTDPTVRGEWLGNGKDPGRLAEVLGRLSTASADGVRLADRYLLREVLRIVNDAVDRGFWVLSMNVLVTVWSASLLGALMLLLGALWRFTSMPRLESLGGTAPARDLALVVVLGAMGAYVGNLLTRKDFLFVQGGPFLRYMLHTLLTKPILGAFAACFVYVFARSGTVFTAGADTATKAAQGIAIAIPAGATGYVYTLLALACGFAADKVLGDMIGAVLRRLEQKAEKSTQAEPTPTS